MRPEVRKYLCDIEKACEAILLFVCGRTLEDYEKDLLLQSGVERQFIIIGEALNKAVHEEPALEEHISCLREIINLRSVIVHGYPRRGPAAALSRSEKTS
ncbi:MAG TPA: DUF86 domain-containing protein [Anaerohalosphaeraceae bacterium]|nr:DUF86 domain-containing protein [Anaerohalosphaeraceae bacterium]